jgi:hypothetical protein
MGIDHRRSDLAVSQSRLHRPHILMGLEPGARTTVAKRLGWDALIHPGFPDRLLHGLLQRRGMHMPGFSALAVMHAEDPRSNMTTMHTALHTFRSPQPYHSFTATASGGGKCCRIAAIASRDHTAGTSGFRATLTTPSTVTNALCSTCRYKHHRIGNAWFWVAADPLRSPAKDVRNSLTSAEASDVGSLLRVHVWQCCTHWVEAFKVFGA